MEELGNRLFQWWTGWFDTGFAAGYWMAIAMMGALLVLWIVVHFIIWLAMRRRRVSAVTMPQDDGQIEVSAKAIFQTVEGLQPEFPVFSVNDIRLYRCGGKKYSLALRFSYQPGNDGLSDSLTGYKKRIRECLEKRFRLTSIDRIDIRLEPSENASGKVNRKPVDVPGVDTGF